MDEICISMMKDASEAHLAPLSTYYVPHTTLSTLSYQRYEFYTLIIHTLQFNETLVVI